MAKAAGKGKGSKGPIKIETTAARDGMKKLRQDLEQAGKDIEKLPQTAKNERAAEQVARRLAQVKAIESIMSSGVCCKEQTQNCEFEVEG